MSEKCEGCKYEDIFVITEKDYCFDCENAHDGRLTDKYTPIAVKPKKIVNYYRLTYKKILCILDKFTDNDCDLSKAIENSEYTTDEIWQAVKIATEQLEYRRPKIPDIEGDGCDNKGNIIYDTWFCPNCNEEYELDYDTYRYCPICGQAIDWSDYE